MEISNLSYFIRNTQPLFILNANGMITIRNVFGDQGPGFEKPAIKWVSSPPEWSVAQIVNSYHIMTNVAESAGVSVPPGVNQLLYLPNGKVLIPQFNSTQ